MKFAKALFCFPLILASSSATLFGAGKKEYTYNDLVLKKTGNYTISTPDNAARPAKPGLLVFFHGSGATKSYAAGFDALDELANRLGLLAMAVQAPNGFDTWPSLAQGPSNQHDQYAKNLLEKVIPTIPNLDKNRILFVGVSAGATFLSGDFLPRYLSRYRGGAVLLCGGGGPLKLDKNALSPLSAGDAQGLPLAFYIQQADFLYRQTSEGVMYWKSRRAKVSFENPPGGSHCGFDVNKEMERLGRQVLSR